ncbi:putative oxidoreductase, aryl-alcohol dehydrogenase like protein [Kitasatospora cheerisanensis KCTC 2395]|uniref:Putative oxidoreductase, aryl-alcohol dehydrogenase like protein n=2 Tax=Kitasatospora cheerisanensis TaxID=81942 RepID=A0A066YWE2_9ACTN|nr:putative oxidoreductase, aryl-alcohol dehydrogenase like protein [Kitasatospora cheerisanensis KCTC 2395]
MTRAGLLVDADTLAAVETLSAVLAISPSDRWGMAPFGGDTTLEVWRAFNARTFLTEGDECTTVQAAFRVAYEIPKVARIAVGTSSSSHLRALVDATTLGADASVVSRYRALLNERAAARS